MERKIGKCIKTRSPFWHDMAIHELPKGLKTVIFPDALFYTFPGICRRFRPKVPSQTPKNAFLGRRSHSKGPHHALEKVLTNETPCIYIYIYILAKSEYMESSQKVRLFSRWSWKAQGQERVSRDTKSSRTLSVSAYSAPAQENTTTILLKHVFQ